MLDLLGSLEPWQATAALVGAADIVVSLVVGWCCLVLSGRCDDEALG
jgi:hypothetical protein